VSCFARLTRTIVADPAPLAPAQVRAHIRTAVPLIADPGYVPSLERLCEEHGVGAVLPLTDLDIEVLAVAREEAAPLDGALGAVAAATYDKYEAHLLLQELGLPRRPRSSARRPDAVEYPVMIKPAALRRRSIHLAKDAAQARFFIDYVEEPRWCSGR